ncbi:putative 3-oxo-5-alpha-steroid 4-dehydrogenase/very-long-chain enoyl-CoA reductase [Helianthus annuus]|nr:putative 3-oxo-5-alpha-steroid 4-dehydrogenase/very-long-chain enoyl-CoA reductase [Helianthus annuus]
MSCISQTPYAFAFTLGTICYLMGRSYATREWYISKFGDKFPKDVRLYIHMFFRWTYMRILD